MSNKTLWIGLIIILLLMATTGVNAALYTFLKKVEENNTPALEAYNDGYGTWTIGYGSTTMWDLNRPVQQGDTIDAATAQRYLEIEANKDLNAVRSLVKVPVTNNQLVAMASFAYNEGIGAFETSTMLSLLNAGTDKNTVANEFDRWIYANGQISQGLVNRRNAEKSLFLS
jgi:lysozyme